MAKEAVQTTTPANWFQDAREYFLGVRAELRKVTWPQRKEAMGGTIGVVVIVGIITLVLGLVDMALGELVRLVLP